MHTWNTITHLDEVKLAKAIFVLETLTDKSRIPIIEQLMEKGSSCLLELSMCMGIEMAQMEDHLRELCQTGVVVRETTFGVPHFRLDLNRIRQVNGIARQINKLRREALAP